MTEATSNESLVYSDLIALLDYMGTALANGLTAINSVWRTATLLDVVALITAVRFSGMPILRKVVAADKADVQTNVTSTEGNCLHQA